MALPLTPGYAIVADNKSITEAYELAHGREAVTAIKAHPRWLTGTNSGDEIEMIQRGNFKVIADTQIALGGEYFMNEMEGFVRRVIPDVVTLAQGLTHGDVVEIARLRDRFYPELTLALTAVLPEMFESDIDQLYGSVARFVDKKCRQALQIGNAIIYGAAGDMRYANLDRVPYMAAGISLSGQPYGENGRKSRGVMAPIESLHKGAHIALLGSGVLRTDNPGAILDGLGAIKGAN